MPLNVPAGQTVFLDSTIIHYMAYRQLVGFVASASRPVAALALVILILSAGCGRSPSGANAKKNGSDADVTYKSKHGEEEPVATGELLRKQLWITEDVAVYPNSRFLGGTGSGASLVGLATADPADKVEAFYRKKVKEDGWSVKSSTNTDRKWRLEAEKGERRKLTVVVSSKSGRTLIDLTLFPSPFNEPERWHND